MLYQSNTEYLDLLVEIYGYVLRWELGSPPNGSTDAERATFYECVFQHFQDNLPNHHEDEEKVTTINIKSTTNIL